MSVPPGPMLMIFSNGQNWKAGISGTEIEYDFIGDTLNEQAATVREMANLMQQGEFNLLTDMVNIFSEINNPAMVYTMFFRNTVACSLEGEILDASSEDGLESVFGELADEILAALVV